VVKTPVGATDFRIVAITQLEANAVIEYSLNSAPYAITWGETIPDYAPGYTSVFVRQVDEAGNTSTAQVRLMNYAPGAPGSIYLVHGEDGAGHIVSDTTLILEGADRTLDISALLPTLPAGTLSNIGSAYINGTGANTLKLSITDVLDISDTNHKLVVHGGADDTVEAAGFTDTGTTQTIVTENASLIFHVYTATAGADTVTLLLQQEIGMVVHV